MKQKTCQYEKCKKEFTPSKYGLKKYCNNTCRGRASQLRQGRDAKELICINCKEPFKRKSAKDRTCIECRKPIPVPGSLAEQYPIMEREIEKDLINNWINNPKNKIKVA